MAARSLARALMDEILEEGDRRRTGKDINGGDAENIRRVKWSFGQKEREREIIVIAESGRGRGDRRGEENCCVSNILGRARAGVKGT